MERTFTPAPLGPRVLAWVIDHALPIIGVLVVALVLQQRSAGSLSAAALVQLVVCLVVTAGWGVYLWWSGGERGATPGLRLMGLEIVSMRDGRPVGWGRFLARMVTVSFLGATVIGWVLMLIWLTADRNRRGWHDMISGAIVTPRRQVQTQFQSPSAGTGRTAVPLPDHLLAWAPTEEPDAGMPQRMPPRPPQAPDHTGAPMRSGHPDPHLAEPTGPEPEYFAQNAGPGFGPGAPGPSSEDAWAPRTADATTPPPPEPTGPQPPAPPDEDPDRTGLRPGPAPAPGEPAQDPDRTVLRPHEPPGEDPDRTSLRGDVQPPGPPAPPRPKWQMVMEDGRVIPLDRAVVVGRRPTQPPGKPVHLVTVEDTTRTLSKSHIRVDADEDSPFVTDLGSTNGSGLVTATGQVDLHAHQPRRIPAGQVVKFGEHRFTVEKTP